MTRGRCYSLLLLAAAALAPRPAPGAPVAATFPPLQQPASREHFPGKFIWADLFTSEPDRAAKFYGDLLGWTAAAIEQKSRYYLVLSNGGTPVAGIVLRRPDASPRPAVWIGYISVVKAKATLTAAVAAGGTEHAPVQQFPQRGAQAIFSDQEGAPVGIIESSSGDGPDDEPRPGDWNWFELYSVRPEVAANFYRQVLGYAVTADARAATAGEHRLLSTGDQTRAGIATLTPGPAVRAGWLGFVRVASLDDTLARVPGLGGEVLVPARPAELGSRFAVIKDSTGGEVGLVQYVDDQNPADHRP